MGRGWVNTTQQQDLEIEKRYGNAEKKKKKKKKVREMGKAAESEAKMTMPSFSVSE